MAFKPSGIQRTISKASAVSQQTATVLGTRGGDRLVPPTHQSSSDHRRGERCANEASMAHGRRRAAATSGAGRRGAGGSWQAPPPSRRARYCYSVFVQSRIPGQRCAAAAATDGSRGGGVTRRFAQPVTRRVGRDGAGSVTRGRAVARRRGTQNGDRVVSSELRR